MNICHKVQGLNFEYISYGLIILSILANIFQLGSIILFLLIQLILIISIKSYKNAAIICSVMIPLGGVLKWSSDNILASAFFSIIIIEICVLQILIFIHKNQNSFIVSKVSLFLFLFYFGILLNITLMFNEVDIFLYYYREYVNSALLFIIFYNAINGDLNFGNYLIKVTFISTAIVAIINIIHYFFGLNIAVDQHIYHYFGEDNISKRVFWGIEIERLKHILGVGTQGGGGAYYSLLGLIGFVLTGDELKYKNKIILLLCSIILMIAAILTGSYSTLFTIVLFLIYFIFTKFLNIYGINKIILMIIFICLTVFIIFILDFEIGSEEISIYNYGLTSFIQPAIDELDSINLLLGNGLGISGAYDYYSTSNVGYFDRWIFGALLQLGIIFFIFMLFIWFYSLYLSIVFYKLLSDLQIKKALFLSGLILICSFGYTHGPAMLSRMYLPIMLIAFAILASTSNKVKPYED